MAIIDIDGLRVATMAENPESVCYFLAPFQEFETIAAKIAAERNLSMAVISGIDWDNELTPWKAPGEPPGSPDFGGQAALFLHELIENIVPEADKAMEIGTSARRTLCGVSLSGLFTLWQWFECDLFADIISLSGSFWYPDFSHWVTTHRFEGKGHKAVFLLGDRESSAPVEAFRSVGRATGEIVGYLRRCGVDADFETVPGNHYQHFESRLRLAFKKMFPISGQ